MAKVEQIKPYSRHGAKTEQVRRMFDSIAPAYDFLNRAMTLGIDKRWRARAVATVAACRPLHIVDIATGTGDMAIKLAHAMADAHITGIDLSQGMIDIGRRKIADAGLTDRIELRVDDCLDSSLPAGCADAVTVAYGVRNFADLEAGYRAMLAMLRPGGTLCVLELSTPQSPLVLPFYKFYTRCIIPIMGRTVSHDSNAYTYLPQSIAAVPQGDDMLALMRRAGFTDTAVRRLTFGVCSLYTARRPEKQ